MPKGCPDKKNGFCWYCWNDGIYGAWLAWKEGRKLTGTKRQEEKANNVLH